MNILLQDKYTYDLKDLPEDVSKTLYLLLLTLYTPKEMFPYKNKYGCSIYDNIGNLDTKLDILEDMKEMAEFLGLNDYYLIALQNIKDIKVKEIVKVYISDDEVAIIRDYDLATLNQAYNYLKGLLVTIEFNNYDVIEIIL